MLDQRIVILFWVLFGGVEAGDGLGAEALILIPDALLLTTFRGFI
jgi:hypothetical protein